MTTAITVVVLYALALLLCWAICADSNRRERSFDAHVEQAVAVIDDGKAPVRETEDFLRGRSA